MSRTNRRLTWFNNYFRHPRTLNEKRQIEALLYDEDYEPTNRERAVHSRKPTAWDDIYISAISELKGRRNKWKI